MTTVKRSVVVMGLTILCIGTIAHSQNTEPKTEISNEQIIKELQAQVERLRTIIKTQEAEIQRLKGLLKKAGIGTEPKAKEPEIQILSKGVEILIKPEVMDDNRVLICGTTNLPVGTGLMVTVLDTPFSRYQAQNKCTVGRNGKFKAGLFSSQGKGLKKGRYAVKVLMPLPQVQPKEVQKIIGDRGQYLRGPLVQRDAFGVTAESSKEFTVGGANARKIQRQRLDKDIASYQKLYYDFDSLYQDIQSARRRNLSDVEWARFLRTFWPRLEKLREKAESYGSDSVGLYLNIAGGDLSILARRANPYLNLSDKEYRTFEGLYKDDMTRAKESLEELKESLSKTD